MSKDMNINEEKNKKSIVSILFIIIFALLLILAGINI